MWNVRPALFAQYTYEKLRMPTAARQDYIELGHFRPADSPDLTRILAQHRIEELRRILGRSFFARANHSAIAHKLFHTWEDFQTYAKQHANPTRAEGLVFGHSLQGFADTHEGYLDYLAYRAPDLWHFLHQNFPARIPLDAFKKHLYCVGMTGSGKSELLKVLAAKLKTQPKATVILLDAERKLAEEVAKSRDHAGCNNLIYIDPALGRLQQRFPIFNPLEYDSEDISEQATYAEVFVEAFREVTKGDTTLRMDMLLKPCIQVLLRRKGSTIADLQRFLEDERNADLVELGLNHPRPEVREFFQFSFSKPDLKRTKDPLHAKLQALRSTPSFADCTIGASSISMKTIIESRKTVVITLDEGELGPQGSRMLGTFFVNLLHATMRRMRSGELHDPDPVYLIVDEFQRFVTPSFAQILARARKLGLHLLASQQFVGQEMDAEFQRNMSINTNIRIVGQYLDSTEAAKAAKMVNLPPEALEGLGKGRYAIKAGNLPAIIVQVSSDRLGNSYTMDAENWRDTVTQQLSTYYRSPAFIASMVWTPPKKMERAANSPTLPYRRYKEPHTFVAR